MQPAIVKHLHVVADNKGHNVVPQALLEQNQPPHTAVAVLKRMNAFEAHMKIQQFLKGLFLVRVVVNQQLLHGRGDLLGRRGLPAADLVGYPFVIAHGEPVQPRIAGAVFQREMQFLDEFFRQCVFCLRDDQVDALEMICRLDDIVHVHRSAGRADGVGLKDVARLVMGQAAALDVVGIIGQIDLHLVINPAGGFRRLLRPQNIQKRFRRVGMLIDAFRFFGVFGDVPCLACQKRAGNFVLGAVIADRPLGHLPFLRRLCHRQIVHTAPPLYFCLYNSILSAKIQ